MKKQYFFMAAFIAVIAAGTFWGCQKDEVLRNPDGLMLKSAHMDECEPEEFTLLAGQHTNVGKLVVSNDGTTLTIEYIFNDPSLVKEIHLWVGTEPYDGTIAPGQFPYKDDEAPIQLKWEIDLEDLFDTYEDACDQEVYILAHAALFNGETVWSQGPETGQNWSMYSMYTICCEETPPGDPECEEWQEETAFGGEEAGGGSAWWFGYDSSKGEQIIYAGQHHEIGTVEYVGGKIIIKLTDGWELNPVSFNKKTGVETENTEPVKIQGYLTLPDSRQEAGKFTTYKGTSLSPDVDAYPYYIIHLDVRKCVDMD